MMNAEKVISDLEQCLDDSVAAVVPADTVREAITLLKTQEPITGETSDGYHTFNELYHHRAVLFSVIVANYKDRAWKSVRHHDGTMYDGMFIVGIDTPDGQATYHYDINPYWDMFDCKVREFAPKWDGHTPAQAIERIGKLKAQEPHIISVNTVKALPNGAVVWQETNHPECERLEAGMVCKREVYAADIVFQTGEVFLDDLTETPEYFDGYKLRYWQGEPTEEQMEETPWEQ